ncbi:unnamed protein product, partial [Rotaria sp. Silwood2]
MIILGIFYILLIVVTVQSTNETSTDTAATSQSGTSNSTVKSTGSSIQKQSIIIPFSIIGIVYLSLKYIN